MKNLIKKSLVFMLLLTTVLVEAKEIKNNVDGTTTLVLSNVKQGNSLIVKDSDGIVLYNEEIVNSGNYTKKFNLTTLPDGTYYFELDKGFQIRTIPFVVKSNIVVLNKAMESIIYKPFIKSKENLVHISNLLLNKQPIKIEIYYYNSESDVYNLIYTETVENTDFLNRVYKLDENQKGDYKVVYKTKKRSFTNYIQF